MKYKETPLKDITAYIYKGIVPKYASQNDTNIIRVLNQRCNRNNLISLSNSRFNNLDKRNVPNEKVLKENDVLINSTGVGTAGRVAQVNDLKEKMTVDGHMIIIRPAKTVNPVFYGYAVIANQYKIEQLAEGSTGQTEINRDRLLKDIYIKLPSLDIQNKIANNLRILDNKISLNNQINANLVDLINTIYNKFCGSFPSINHETIKDIFCVKTTTYKVSKNRNTNIWHFSIPNFDNGKIGKLENTSDIKSNKKLVNDFSVLISKLNPRFKRVWAPDLTSYPKYESVASPEFIQVSGKDIEQQAVVFAILNSRNYSNFLVSNATGSTNSRQRVKPQIAYSYKIPFNTGKMENLGRYLKPLLQQIQQNEAENNNLQNLKETLLVELF